MVNGASRRHKMSAMFLEQVRIITEAREEEEQGHSYTLSTINTSLNNMRSHKTWE